MKLEVGMYVRNDYFGIGKIDKDYFDSNNKHWFNVQFNCYGDDDCHCGICEQSIGYKASHNIIDLIEERDFVKVRIDGIFINWFMVDLFEDEDGNQELGIGCYEDGLLNSISEYRPLNTLEVLEVATKEQFESMSYKVGV